MAGGHTPRSPNTSRGESSREGFNSSASDEEIDSDNSSSYAGSAASIAAIQESAEHQVTEQIVQAFDPLPLDRALVVQARLSGMLHAQSRELSDVESKASAKLKHAKELSIRSRELISRTSANVDWLMAHIDNLHERLRYAHPIEYAQASDLEPDLDAI